MVDLDGDGRRDVLSGSWPGTLHWFRGAADGTFEACTTLKDAEGAEINLGNASVVQATDWDRDGDVDLVVGDIEGRVHLVPNGSGDKTLKFGKALRLEAGGSPIAVPGHDAGPHVADWDADGRADLLVGSGDGSVVWYRDTAKEGPPALAAAETLVTASIRANGEGAERPKDAPSGYRSKICVTDWNGDGRMDLLMGDFESRQGKAPELTAEQVKERDALQAEQQASSEQFGRCLASARAKVTRDLNLTEPPKDPAALKDFNAKVAEALEADEVWKGAQAKNSALWEKLRPLLPPSEMHGSVWLYLRSVPPASAPQPH